MLKENKVLYSCTNISQYQAQHKITKHTLSQHNRQLGVGGLGRN